MKRFNAVMNGDRPFIPEDAKFEMQSEAEIKEKEKKADLERLDKSLGESRKRLKDHLIEKFFEVGGPLESC